MHPNLTSELGPTPLSSPLQSPKIVSLPTSDATPPSSPLQSPNLVAYTHASSPPSSCCPLSPSGITSTILQLHCICLDLQSPQYLLAARMITFFLLPRLTSPVAKPPSPLVMTIPVGKPLQLLQKPFIIPTYGPLLPLLRTSIR